MRVSQLFGRTLRQAPSEADTVSHPLLLRAGLAQQLAAGVYSYLPLGWQVLRKIEQVIREEMNAAGGQELLMPALQPVELWEESGRRQAFGENLFVLKDRRQRELALGPTHEEVIVDLVKRQVQSYRELPLLLYQIQMKFRDEARPRGGLIRLRQFIMKDLYSFHADWESLDETYRRLASAYKSIFDRCGVPTTMVEADSGAMGGRDCHEFMFLCESGEDETIHCSSCGYAANAERATFRKVIPEWEAAEPMKEVATPGARTIDEVATFLSLPREKTLKAVFYLADEKPVFVAIRGDMEVNETKLTNAVAARTLRLMNDAELRERRLVSGAASPVGLKGITVVTDEAVPKSPNLVGGANQAGGHLININYERDWRADLVTDIALARASDPCIACGGLLETKRAIEMGHIFKLGTVYSEKLGATFLDSQGKSRPAVMGCYGIGVERLLAAAIEANHDDRGIIWPHGLAPYQVHLVAISVERDEVAAAAQEICKVLQAGGISVLYDDREESPGVKFNDADLLGLPLRLTVSPRTLERGVVEMKSRREGQTTLIPGPDLPAAVTSVLADLTRSSI